MRLCPAAATRWGPTRFLSLRQLYDRIISPWQRAGHSPVAETVLIVKSSCRSELVPPMPPQRPGEPRPRCCEAGDCCGLQLLRWRQGRREALWLTVCAVPAPRHDGSRRRRGGWLRDVHLPGGGARFDPRLPVGGGRSRACSGRLENVLPGADCAAPLGPQVNRLMDLIVNSLYSNKEVRVPLAYVSFPWWLSIVRRPRDTDRESRRRSSSASLSATPATPSTRFASSGGVLRQLDRGPPWLPRAGGVIWRQPCVDIEASRRSGPPTGGLLPLPARTAA